MTTFPLIHGRVWRRAHRRDRVADAARAALQLRLVASGEGWSLVSLDGHPVFSAHGPRGRRRCLQFAQRQGVVALVS